MPTNLENNAMEKTLDKIMDKWTIKQISSELPHEAYDQAQIILLKKCEVM